MNLFIVDTDNDRIRKVDAATGIIRTVGGNGTRGFSGDNGLATEASLNRPFIGVAVDAAGNLFIADSFNNRIRKVDAVTRIITTVTGGGNPPDLVGDNWLATAASLNRPIIGVAVHPVGNLFIADTLNDRIRGVQGPIP
ncbi:hypothetical protein MYX84_03875 [Acidobacteria bacterium AH-259-O06]|nr:hypothetical protein [Acidobacteria bacterium AH-259-O06]